MTHARTSRGVRELPETMSHHLDIHVKDRLTLLDTPMQVESIEAGQVVLRNLKHDRLVTVPASQVKLMIAESRFREQLTDADTREIEQMAEDEAEDETADPDADAEPETPNP